MKRISLDASHDTLDKVYDAVERQLGLKKSFGRNLDALWDVLTKDVRGPIEFVWQDRGALGPDGDRLLATLHEVARERKDFRLILERSSGRT
jgi:ribonuclease inhibitor